MEVTKLSSDKSEILVQLYDSLEDVLEKGNELDKRILEQMDAFNKVENELLDLDKRFDSLKSNNVDNLTTNGAKDAGDIVREIISKKKEKQDLLDTDQILYKEYMIITNEIKRIQCDIDNVLNEEEIETLSANTGLKVETLNTVVHIKHTDFGYIILEPISIENSEISETTANIVNEISRKFKLNEEETKESNNPHEMLIDLYNSRNRQKEENQEFLNRIPKFIEKNNGLIEKNTDNNADDNKEDSQIDSIINEIDSNQVEEDSVDNSMVESISNQNIESNADTLEQPNESPINLNVIDQNTVPSLNINNDVTSNENKIVGMPSLDLPTGNLAQTSNIEPSVPELNVPTFEVPAPTIPLNVEPNIDVNNNVPLNEAEVNSILAGNKVDEPVSKEEISEVIINEPSEPAKIANSTEAKVQTILGVWSKYKVPKTIIKYDIKKDENVVPLDAILSSSDHSENTTQNNIQSFFSNAA